MAAKKAFSFTPPLRPEPRWQGMAVSLAIYAALFLAGVVLQRHPLTSSEQTATPAEIAGRPPATQ